MLSQTGVNQGLTPATFFYSLEYIKKVCRQADSVIKQRKYWEDLL